MFLVRQILKFLELLHSETSRNQLASGFALGLCMGFVPPSAYLVWIFFFIVLIWFRINFGAAFFSLAIFKTLSFALDPLFHKVGRHVLVEMPALKPVWVWAYQAPALPYTYFYNSIVMGSLVISLVAAIPFFFFSRLLIDKYRKEVVERIKTTLLWKAWKASKLYSLYDKYQQFGN